MRFALEVRHGREHIAEFARELASAIDGAGGEVVTSDDDADLILAVGGDGTMLAAVQRALARDIPVLGFNLGTLGFLAEAEADEMGVVVGRLLAGDYGIEQRMTIQARVGSGSASGVNDVVVEKVDSQRLVELAVSIDGSGFVTYRADGLIAATPTGSTAYAFSAGGPLMDPSLKAIILAPVAAHSLFDRTLVLAADSVIDIEVVRDRSVHVAVDKGDLGYLEAGETVQITEGERPARFVTLNSRSFTGLVKSKFDLA